MYLRILCFVVNYYRNLLYDKIQSYDADPSGPPAKQRNRQCNHHFLSSDVQAIENLFGNLQESGNDLGEWYNPSAEFKEGKFVLCLLVLCWHGTQNEEVSVGLGRRLPVAQEALKAWVKAWNWMVLEWNGLV